MSESPTSTGEEPVDEHGCKIGKEIYNEESKTCVPIVPEGQAITDAVSRKAVNRLSAQAIKMALERDKWKTTATEVTKRLHEADNVLEAQARATTLRAIMGRTSMSDAELAEKPLSELESIKATLDSVKAPTHKGIRIGKDDPSASSGSHLKIGSLIGVPLGKQSKDEK